MRICLFGIWYRLFSSSSEEDTDFGLYEAIDAIYRHTYAPAAYARNVHLEIHKEE